MKTKLLLLILFLQLSSIYSQTDTIVRYYNEDWKKTSAENATYYGHTYKVAKKKWGARDYYLNGQVQMEGFYKSKRNKKRVGLFSYYYSNGELEKKGSYNSKGYKVDEWAHYFENGQLKSIGSYNESGYEKGVWNYYFENGQLKTTGTYTAGGKETGIWTYYFEDGTLDRKKEFGFPITTTYYHGNGEISAIQIYDSARKKSIMSYFHEDGTPLKEGEVGYADPEFVGGEEAMGKFIVDHVNYPQKAIDKGQHGTSYISFVVEKDGSLNEIQVIISSYPLLDEEALRVVKLMPNWIPGKANNRPERFKFTLPVHFRLT